MKGGKEACWSFPKHLGKHMFCPLPHSSWPLYSQFDPTLLHQQQAVPPNNSPAGTAEIRASHRRMNRCFVVPKQWYSHAITSPGTQMNKNYQPRWLQLGFLSWGIKMSLWKLPPSAFTGYTPGAEPGGPGLFCQDVNWLPVPMLPVCGWRCRTLQPFKPQAVLTTLFHSLLLLPMLLALQVAVPYPCSQQGGNEALHIPLSLTAEIWGACPPNTQTDN